MIPPISSSPLWSRYKLTGGYSLVVFRWRLSMNGRSRVGWMDGLGITSFKISSLSSADDDAHRRMKWMLNADHSMNETSHRWDGDHAADKIN